MVERQFKKQGEQSNELEIERRWNEDKKTTREVPISEFIKQIEKDIQTTKEDIDISSSLARLKEIQKVYSGVDEIITTNDLIELMKNRKEVQTFSSGVYGLDKILGGFTPSQLVVISAATKAGKCLAKGTEVLMYDGSLKKIEDIKVGEKVMSINSKPRTVLGLGKGTEEMYRITQRGAEYVVNKSHILSLKKTGDTQTSHYKGRVTSSRYSKGKIVNISVEDYLKKSNNFKHLHKGYKTGVSFCNKKVPIEPYFLGLWLGDGTTSSVDITSNDFEVAFYLEKYAGMIGLKLKSVTGGKRADKYSITRGFQGNSQKFSLQGELNKVGVLNNKHIPKEYLINSEKNRLELLAGLLDSDGHLTKTKYPYFEITTKLKVLADNIYFLSSSLGFQTRVVPCKKGIKSRGFMGNYFRISIAGDIWKIPTKIKRKKAKNNGAKHKDVLTSQIKITPLGKGKYYGFELDGDGLFVLGNFVVTHNTSFSIDMTTKWAHLHPLWFSFEESVEELIQKFIDRNEEPPYFTLPKTMKGDNLVWIEKKIIEAIAKYDTKVVFIDHLHFIVPFSEERQDLRIGQTMRELKTIARRWNITIFLIAHLKKTKVDAVPSMEDLRDSSFVAQEADTVLFLWRETMKSKGEITITNNVVLSVQANRRTGKTGNVKLVFDNGHFKEEEWVQSGAKSYKDDDDF